MDKPTIEYLNMLRFERAILLAFEDYLLADSLENLYDKFKEPYIYYDDIEVILRKEAEHYCLYVVLEYRCVKYVKLVASFDENLRGDILAMTCWDLNLLFDTESLKEYNELYRTYEQSNAKIRDGIESILLQDDKVASKLTLESRPLFPVMNSSGEYISDKRVVKYNKILCIPIKYKSQKGDD